MIFGESTETVYGKVTDELQGPDTRIIGDRESLPLPGGYDQPLFLDDCPGLRFDEAQPEVGLREGPARFFHP